MQLELFGRSSSHFTRITRIVAHECSIEYAFRIVRDLNSRSTDDYGGNPALRIPTLRVGEASWFGALNIARELERRSRRRCHVIWPEQLTTPIAADAQELVLQSMATEVALVMAGKNAQDGEYEPAHTGKMQLSLHNMLEWLDQHVGMALATLPPERDLSYLEVSLYCLLTHLEFRRVLTTGSYHALTDFVTFFGARDSALATAFQFDS
jgi:glutathione S-transferase